jgi:[acyl-carrier-protein] S-malonyltransferase
MKPAADKLAIELANIKFNSPQIPVVQNVNASITTDVETLKSGLVEQLYSPVLWTKTVLTIIAKNDVGIIVECGPGKVLSGLNKRIHETAQLFNLHGASDFDKLIEALK